jgi:hypothetical protein
MERLLLDNLDTIAGIVSAVLTAIALFASWRSWRRSELRRDDVLAWASEAIAAMQSLRLITSSARTRLSEEQARERLGQLVFDTSILVERGRLFFRNAADRRHGRDKPHAYRGRRPVILDQLVLAHQIACAWPEADAEARRAMAVVAQDVTRRFVSLVQMEVGRVRSASADARRRGDGMDLAARVRDLDPARLEAATGNIPDAK